MHAELILSAQTKKAIEKSVDNVIKGRLDVIVTKELGNFVEGHLAKRKLTGRSPPDMTTLIDKRLQQLVRTEVSRRTRDVRMLVDNAIDRKIDAAVKQVLAAKSKKLRDSMMREVTGA